MVGLSLERTGYPAQCWARTGGGSRSEEGGGKNWIETQSKVGLGGVKGGTELGLSPSEMGRPQVIW